MGNRQFLAQIGVFILVGLNVAAYYVFWPKADGGGEVRPPEQLVQSLRVEKKPAAPKLPEAPAEFPTAVEAARIAAPVSPVSMDVKKEPDGDALSRLLDQIKNDAPLAADPPPPSPPAPLKVEPMQPFTMPELPRTLPPLSADPVPLPRDDKKPTPTVPIQIADPVKQIVSPAGLNTKLQPSPWLLKMEIVGDQTQLIAQLKPKLGVRALAEFKILCDRVEMKAPDGTLQAVGKVTFAGAGLTGSCQRLTLPLSEQRILFEDDVRVAYEPNPLGMPTPNYLLRGDRFAWEMAGAATDRAPVTFSPPMP